MKLTNDIRSKIVDAAVAASKLPSMRKETELRSKKLALKAWGVAVNVPKEIREMPSAMRGEWLQQVTKIEIEAEGFSSYRYFGSKYDHGREILNANLELYDPVPVPVRFGRIKVSEYPLLKTMAANLIAQHREANAYEDDLCQKLRAIVYSANTAEQLLKSWPEGKKFLPPVPVKTRALVDTKTVADVNKVLGLP